MLHSPLDLAVTVDETTKEMSEVPCLESLLVILQKLIYQNSFILSQNTFRR